MTTETMEQKPKRKRGRPKGSRNKKKSTKRGRPPGAKTKAAQHYVLPQSCRRCGSTERTAFKRNHREVGPLTIDGVTYRRVIKRRCACTNCGQVRIENECHDPQ